MSAAVSLGGCTQKSDLEGFVVILFQWESQYQVVTQSVGLQLLVGCSELQGDSWML